MPLPNFVELENITHTSIDVGTTSTTACGKNPSSRYRLLVNISDTDMFLSMNGEAALSKGVKLYANGGSYEMGIKWGNLYAGACYIIHGGSGNKTLLVTEGR